MMRSPLLDAPIAPMLFRLAWPTLLAMGATMFVAIAETSYVGALGTPALAGLALVFPMAMLQQMLSNGAMGGGVSSSIARALGARDEESAGALAFHATLIGLCAGVFFSAIIFLFGDPIYRALGGRGAELTEALAYSHVFALGVLGIWMTNTFVSVLRGGGDMRSPSLAMLVAAVVQIAVGGALGLGLGPFPRWGMAGVASGQTVAFIGVALFLLFRITRENARVRLTFRGQRISRAMFADILRVGALACVSPVQSVATVLVLTKLVSFFGVEALAGYGIGARLEFLLTPFAFAFGVACIPMVGMAMGAHEVGRARRVAWTGATIAAICLGAIGFFFAIFPDLWAVHFTNDAGVLQATRDYLRWTGPAYPFFGFGMCLFFASQGAGRVLGPVLSSTLRLATIAGGGAIATALGAPLWVMFALVGLALVLYGLATGASVYFTRWGPPAPAGPKRRRAT